MERLHKLLAAAGHGSRRACEELIRAGRVAVDGKVVRELGLSVDPARQEVRCDGEVLRPEPKVYFLLNKPRGVVCTNFDPANRPKVVDLFKGVCQRIYTVGRLDEDSEGLIVVTNDGELTNLLTHPRFGVPKTYRVVLRGYFPPEKMEKVQQGVWLAEGKTAPLKVRMIKRTRQKTILEVTLKEGINREVRRIFARFGHPVSSLVRIRIGGLTLGPLPPGQYRAVSREMILAAMETGKGGPPPRNRGRRGKGESR